MNHIARPDVPQFIRAHFGDDRQKSSWLQAGEVSVYIRAGALYVPEHSRVHQVVSIANVSVPKALQGQGLFRNFLKDVMDKARDTGYHSIRVEQVLNSYLDASFRRRRWNVAGELWSPTYWTELH